MKSIIQMIITASFITYQSYSQIDHVDSVISENQENSLELFGTDDLLMSKDNRFIYAFSDTSILYY